MKRTILLLLFLGIIPLACEKVDEYYVINSLTSVVYKDDALLVILAPTDTVTNGIVYFKISMIFDYISYSTSKLSLSFSTPLQAFSKGKPGKDGLKTKLESIKIFSNNIFNGHDAGTDLKGLFKWHDVQWDGRQKPIDSLVIALNRTAFFIGETNEYFFKLILNDKPIDGLQHIFSFDFIYENGTHQLFNSTTVNWGK